IASREARAAGCNHHIDVRIGYPALHPGPDAGDLVLDDAAVCKLMTGGTDHLRQNVAGPIISAAARVRDRQYRNAYGDEGTRLIDFGHVAVSVSAIRVYRLHRLGGHCIRLGARRAGATLRPILASSWRLCPWGPKPPEPSNSVHKQGLDGE